MPIYLISRASLIGKVARLFLFRYVAPPVIYWNSFLAYFPCSSAPCNAHNTKINWTLQHLWIEYSPHMICFRNFSWGFSISFSDEEHVCFAASAAAIWNRLARLSSIEKPDSDRLFPPTSPEISLFSLLLLRSENSTFNSRVGFFFSLSSTSSSVNQNLVSAQEMRTQYGSLVAHI